MRTLKWIGGAAVAVLVVVTMLMVLARRPEPPSPVPAEQPPETLTAESEPAAAASRVPLSPPASRPSATAPVARPAEAAVLESRSAPGDIVPVKPGQTLATVNGVAITLADLMPLTPDKANSDQTISGERYGFLLNRAIEREVMFQAARSQGVELTEAQRKRLEALRARSEQVEPGVFDTVQQNSANVKFEQRDAMGLLLQAALAEKAGVPSPHVTAAQVQAYYEAHASEYGALPADPSQRQAAWERIDQAIRLKLAPEVQAEHQQRLREFVEQLKATAEITAAPPAGG